MLGTHILDHLGRTGQETELPVLPAWAHYPPLGSLREKEEFIGGRDKDIFYGKSYQCAVYFNTPPRPPLERGLKFCSHLEKWESSAMTEPRESSKVPHNKPTIVLLQTQKVLYQTTVPGKTVPHSWSLTLSLPSTNPLTTAANGWIRGSRKKTWNQLYIPLSPKREDQGRPELEVGRSFKLGKCFCFFKINFNWNLITILWWFFRTLTWISRGCTCVPHPELPHLPPHPLPLGYPSVLALSVLLHASSLDWSSVSHMVIYMFQRYSLKSSHPRLLPQSPKVCSLHLCLFCCLAYRVIVTGSEGKVSASNAGDPDSTPGSGRSPEEGNGNPLQYSCLEDSMDWEAW